LWNFAVFSEFPGKKENAEGGGIKDERRTSNKQKENEAGGG